MLRKYQLQFLTRSNDKIGAGFRAATNPIYSTWRYASAIGFNRNFKSLIVERVHRFFVQLQQRFATGADDKWADNSTPRSWPSRCN